MDSRSCEHYDPIYSRDHLINFDVGNGLYDTDYLEALFTGDELEVRRLEEEAFVETDSPLTMCFTVYNSSSVRAFCGELNLMSVLVIRPTILSTGSDHRDAAGSIVRAEMVQLPCTSRIRLYEPLEEYRTACPHVLVICQGAHSHPIPQPLKTPPLIRLQIFNLLSSIGQDLADLTPRRFLRHPSVIAYLRQRLPNIPFPSLSDLHVSLSNRDHLQSYIDLAKARAFPEGTGWEGTT